MREVPVEKHLRDEVKKLGGRCVKLNPAGAVGIPDRLIILPGVLVFAELKRPKGGVISGAQKLWHSWLREQGHCVEVLSTKGEVDEFIKNIRGDALEG